MKKTFFTSLNRVTKLGSLSSSQPGTLPHVSGICTDGQKARDEVKSLCEQKKYEEALKKINGIEENFPSCIKAAKYYRGEATYELRKERGELPKMTHMEN